MNAVKQQDSITAPNSKEQPKNDKGKVEKTRSRLAHNRMRNAVSRLLAKGTFAKDERISLNKAQSVVNYKDLAASSTPRDQNISEEQRFAKSARQWKREKRMSRLQERL